MSFTRIFVPSLFMCVIASQAFATEDRIEIAQFGPSQEEMFMVEQEASANACQGKPLGAACSYQSPSLEQVKSGTCVQPPAREVDVGYDTATVTPPVSCQ